ncbi:GMC family oxidoreductase [Mesorhizobium sp. INR15]|uniref:GMC family oxidoreductase n=1 Tax=Mesorhizobium sp. INR15 TaxID=2654248 RepID=UPI0018967D3F|nr:GMC family oxidoreductase N-terminal domain-containing protein [Mesorhizobium sp. INR15]QPC95521.1 FAD-binding protein [Mesorhizobium sp. INR15]
MMVASSTFDFVIVGAGAAGCAVASGLIDRKAGSVLIVEAGPPDSGMLVTAPLGLVWLMGGKRDWKYRSAPQSALGGRRLKIPRGRMLGGSSSINSMVWFRGRRDDFDNWDVDGWRWSDVEPAFQAIEERMRPSRLADPHPLSEALQSVLGNNGTAPPTPEYESAGIFHFNMRRGRRWSAADAFLRPARAGGLEVLTDRQVDHIEFVDRKASAIVLSDGSTIRARKGIVLSAGSIGSPEILLRSGVGPADDLESACIRVVADADGVGRNLQDHPAVGIHYVGARSGYGPTVRQVPLWVAAPFRYLTSGTGPIGSPTVEAGAFFNARNDGGPPDIQVHFLPFMMGWRNRLIVPGSGYFSDVCVCRPRSRGSVRLTNRGLEIDLGLFTDPADLDLLVAGFRRLRQLMEEAPFGSYRGLEAFPGVDKVRSDEEIRQHVLDTAGTAYHPVGTLRMGEGPAPVTPRLAMKGVSGLWVADASVMPQLTSANTNAPSIMIGHRAAGMIAEDAG